MEPISDRIETTGRYLVLLPEGDATAAVRTLGESLGVEMVGAHTLEQASVGQSDAVYFESLGVAVVSMSPEQADSVRVLGQDNDILAIEPERINYVLNDVGFAPSTETATLPAAYLQGYRDAVLSLVNSLLPPGEREQAIVETTFDESQATWGLQATRVVKSRFSGRGIKLAVLDTGFDLKHPDFAGRTIVTNSFVSGQPVQDGHGHGTHCIGTACGPLKPAILPRYGIAYGTEIYAGKVLSNAGSGSDSQILAGIDWAIRNGCAVISMSLGASTAIGEPFSQVYEAIAQRALRAGTLIVAAAGNESDRRAGSFKPVGRPANCPSILAVGAIDAQLQVANFSCRGLNPNGGEVNIAAPGVDVYSTWPLPTRYRRLNGTSMATPHVAGIAALYAEATGKRGYDLWRIVLAGARHLPLPAADVGAGLVQAP